jgi:hypothetical protein
MTDNLITVRNWLKRAVHSDDNNRLIGWAVIEGNGTMRIDLDELPVSGRLHLPNFVEKDSSLEALQEESDKVRERIDELLHEGIGVELVKESLERTVALQLEELKQTKGVLKSVLKALEWARVGISAPYYVEESIKEIKEVLND